MNEQKLNPRSAFSAWEILVVVAIVVVVAAIAIPKARATSSANACINNLRQIDAAANQFALEKGLTNGQSIYFPNDLTPYVKLNSAGKMPPCPAGGIYYIARVGKQPVCSIGGTMHTLP
jgi:type IV pilus assembly protein PilA